MAIEPGQSLLHYRITDKIGQGGMGEVWEAVDTKLDRKVAIKVLPDAFSADAERLARFEREAKLLASLNHANIATIHGIEHTAPSEGSQQALRFLVMERVEGEDVAQRLARGRLSADEATAIAIQIAEALEAAHDNGVIHRDLKPANVKLTPEGKVKVLDFGLAKAMDPLDGVSSQTGASLSPTVTSANTLGGMILGTAAYMSPEQAKGTAVDRRADVWSFGCVLYEMLAGRQPFHGETVSETLASVMKDAPDLEALPADTPPPLRALLRRCLQKDPRRRLQAIGEARIALESPQEIFPPAESAAAAPPTVAPGSRLAWVVTAIAVVAALVLAWGPWRSTPPPPGTTRVKVGLASELDFNSGIPIDLSRDGRSLVYAARDDETRQLYLRRLGAATAVPLSGTEGAARPFFSPDGAWVAFFEGGKLKKVSVSGGVSLTLCEARSSRGADWGTDGTIVFTPGPSSALFRVSEAGGEPTALTTLDEAAGERSHRWPRFLPDGRGLIFTSSTASGGYSDATIELLDLDSGERRVLHRGGAMGRYLPSGHVIFVREGTVFGLPFDVERREVTGAPVPLLEDVTFSENQGDAWLATSLEGTVVYREGARADAAQRLVELDLDGVVTTLTEEPDTYDAPAYSPDGSRIAFELGSRTNQDVWIYDTEREDMQRLTFEESSETRPSWTPDGRRVVFSSDRRGAYDLYWKEVDGSGAAEPLAETDTYLLAGGWSPDGAILPLMEFGSGRSGDILLLHVNEEGEDRLQPFATTEFREVGPRVSPDGRWLAYLSNESGRNEVYAQPFPRGGTKTKISTDGATGSGRWSPEGTKIYYESRDRLMVVDVAADGNRLRAGKPAEAFLLPRGVDIEDISPDGRKFLALQSADEDQQSEDRKHLQFVFHWFTELADASTR